MQLFTANSAAHEIPDEILQVILEYAFDTRPHPVQFSLVSWGVKNIVEPLIYRDISLTTSRRCNMFLRTWDERLSPKNTKNTNFYQSHVKGFFIRAYMDADRLVGLLLGFPGIENLSVRVQTRIAPIEFCFNILRETNSTRPCGFETQHSPLDEEGWLYSPPRWSATSDNCEGYFKHLRRLSLWALFHPGDPIKEFSFTHQFFRNLTHLDILITSNIPIWDGLRHLQHLTHVSFSWMTLEPTPTNEFWKEWITRLLAACPETTELIIFWCINKDTPLVYNIFGSQMEDSDTLQHLSDQSHRTMSVGPVMPLSHSDPAEESHFLLRLITGQVDPRAIAGSTDFYCSLDHLPEDLIIRSLDMKLHEGDWDFPLAPHDGPDIWTIGEEIVERRRKMTCP